MPATAGGRQRRLHVQVKRSMPGGPPAVLCGTVAELRDIEGEWFRIDTAIGLLWATGKNVRMCSGDGRCTCEAEEAEGRPC